MYNLNVQDNDDSLVNIVVINLWVLDDANLSYRFSKVVNTNIMSCNTDKSHIMQVHNNML